MTGTTFPAPASDDYSATTVGSVCIDASLPQVDVPVKGGKGQTSLGGYGGDSIVHECTCNVDPNLHHI